MYYKYQELLIDTPQDTLYGGGGNTRPSTTRWGQILGPRKLYTPVWSCADQKSEKNKVPVKKLPRLQIAIFGAKLSFGAKQYIYTNLGAHKFFDTALLSSFRIA